MSKHTMRVPFAGYVDVTIEVDDDTDMEDWCLPFDLNGTDEVSDAALTEAQERISAWLDTGEPLQSDGEWDINPMVRLIQGNFAFVDTYEVEWVEENT